MDLRLGNRDGLKVILDGAFLREIKIKSCDFVWYTMREKVAVVSFGK